jgi:hypothetical protein
MGNILKLEVARACGVLLDKSVLTENLLAIVTLENILLVPLYASSVHEALNAQRKTLSLRPVFLATIAKLEQ